MNKLTDRKQIQKITYLFMITYMVSYITRINFGAIVSEMVNDTGISKSMLSLSLTGSFVTYGVGQIISGICGDKFRPKKLVFYGLLASIVMNLLIPFCSSPKSMLVIWSINGFAQAFMWPPIVKLISELLNEEDYKKACVIISRGSACGTISIYLLGPALIALSSWRLVFIFSAVCGIIMLVLWNALCIDVQNEAPKADSNTKKSGGINTQGLFTPLMFGVMFAIVLQGILRDGVTTWMPSYISETYHLGSEISILTGIVMPIFSIFSFQIAADLYKKKFTNPLMCSAVMFGVGAAVALALYYLSGSAAIVSVLFSALLTGCMHGINLILITMLPAFFSRYGNVSTASGVLNACTYIGSAISTYGIAVIAENKGWSFTIFIWFIIAFLGFGACMLCVKPWKKEYM